MSAMERYKEIRIIGRGNFGQACLVKDRETGRKLVVKKIPLGALSDKERETAHHEAQLLSRLSHPNILEYVTSFLEKDTLHIVTAYCEAGDLAALIKRRKSGATDPANPSATATSSSSHPSISSFSPSPGVVGSKQYLDESVILDVFIQLSMGLDYIHSLKIMHRDLKTGNVFVTRKNVVKLGDFGIAKVLDTELKSNHTVVGTPHFMSPEVCGNKPYDFKSDVWSLGCVLYELCALEHAFDASNILGLAYKIVHDEAPSIPDIYSDELKSLVKQLLAKDPRDRPTVVKIFAMPFIRALLEKMARCKDLPQLPSSQPTAAHEGVPEMSPSLLLVDPIGGTAPHHRRERSRGSIGHNLDTIDLVGLKRTASQQDKLDSFDYSAVQFTKSSTATNPNRAAVGGTSISRPGSGSVGHHHLPHHAPAASVIPQHHRSRSSIIEATNYDEEFASFSSAASHQRRESPPSRLVTATTAPATQHSSLLSSPGVGVSSRGRVDSATMVEEDLTFDAVRVMQELRLRTIDPSLALGPEGQQGSHGVIRSSPGIPIGSGPRPHRAHSRSASSSGIFGSQGLLPASVFQQQQQSGGPTVVANSLPPRGSGASSSRHSRRSSAETPLSYETSDSGLGQ